MLGDGKVEPSSGIVPANSQQTISLTFRRSSEPIRACFRLEADREAAGGEGEDLAGWPMGGPRSFSDVRRFEDGFCVFGSSPRMKSLCFVWIMG